ncbi:MAG: hypothetical protein GXY38_10965 [Planctomycetes bacterium]|nr:hypothetical protein [Planctomycetota bacterium]
MATVSLSAASIEDLQSELRKRQKQLPKLQQKRRQLLAQLAEIDRCIFALGGGASGPAVRASAPAGNGKRLSNGKTLSQQLVELLGASKSGMRISELVKAVRHAGYKSAAKDFYSVVAMALRDKKFQKVDRGVYKIRNHQNSGAQATKPKRAKKAKAAQAPSAKS